ncbi:CRISPR-associated protein Cas4 [Isachenkonia alkalipeptolytica]|uniref:CRISPR-associated exonuclease Cas4 n=1 Tax=Isachenkonia alkalipeptolytica TaxID=2565777 RepID=A0AA43XJ96_9CLOT|nr:CRISPR-associated protein Cas4 [Isachenkonia alkalipeptolytica]NBG87364.1 CRISPR-associated protein Cas4 [Isachenkonia alkalipeptolytica]
MKSYPSSFKEFEYFITPSDMIEYLYCPRFIYYMKVLGIKQYEDKRYKVQKGRTLHDKKEEENRKYLRKKIGAINKETAVSLISNEMKVRGIVDEVLTLKDGTMAPLDYKFAKYEEKIYKTLRTQTILYSIMIEEVYNKKVDRGYIVYCRGGDRLVEVSMKMKDKENVKKDIMSLHKVLAGYFPKATTVKARCTDCTYKNICIQ